MPGLFYDFNIAGLVRVEAWDLAIRATSKTLPKATVVSHFKKGAFTAHHTNIFKLVTFNNNAAIVQVTDLKTTSMLT